MDRGFAGSGIDSGAILPHALPVAPTRHFHDWKEPALQAAVELLTRPWVQGGHQGPLDLRGTWILVPTRHAGRRLRADLARFAADHGSAVLSGPISTPEHLVASPPDAAPEPLALAVLAQCLLANRARLSHLLPAGDPDGSFSSALGLAAQIQEVRRQLADADVSPAQVQGAAPDPEKDRWADIVVLEEAYLQALRRRGLCDALQARREAAVRPPAPACSTVDVLFIPDLSPLAARTLAGLAGSCDVRIHVLAPETEADRFDPFGRPLPDAWETALLPLSESDILVFEQADDETETLAALLEEAQDRNRALVLCTPDPGQAQALARRLQADDHPLYLPNGIPLAATSPGRLLSAWLSFLRHRDMPSAAAFLRHPDARDWLQAELGLSSSADLLTGFDRCRSAHLPVRFDDLAPFAREDDAGAPLVRALDLLGRHAESPLPEFLTALYDCRRTGGGRPDPLYDEAAQAMADLLQSAADSAEALELDAPEARDLLLALLPRRLVFPRPDESAEREATGWLEVQWETAPALVLADMREGVVPENRIADAFLPDGLCRCAGMPANRDRLARDLYLARCLIEPRPPGGIRFLYSRRAASQEPQLPSRLLLACPDADLPARIDALFSAPALRTVPVETPPPPALGLSPPPCPPDRVPVKLSVTDFRAYLACPFRFYLSRVLGMQPLDASARELDPGAFGTLAHDALRCLADFPDFDDEDKLAGILLARLAKRTLRQFGPTPSLAVRIQLRSLQQRLRAAARIHAAAVREGWRIAQAEESFIGEIDGMPVHARIDRIDRHTDGRIRILDYKTANTARSPRETHYRPVLQRWDDLQLPLYRHLYEQRNPGAPPPTVAYFHLPQASADAKIEEFDLPAELVDSALAAARGVIAGIRARRFWPPAAMSPDLDDFALLFAGGSGLIREPDIP